MGSIVNIQYCICLTSITGGVISIIWYLLGRLLEKAGFLNIVYTLLKVTTIFWILPVAYISLIVVEKKFGMWHGVLFMRTPALDRISKIIFILWVLAIMIGAVRYILNNIAIFFRLKKSIECDVEIKELVDTICGEYKINPKRVRIRYSYADSIPKVAFCIRPVIFIPIDKLEKQSYKIIFKHELMHIKHGDLIFKNLLKILCAIHFFNSIIWWMDKQLEKWSEFACDYEICIRDRRIKEYYQHILDISMEHEVGIALVSMLYEDKSKLRERMEHVMKSYKVQNKSKSKAKAIIAVIMAVSIVSVSVTSVKAADCIEDLYWDTQVSVREDLAADGQTEYIQEHLDDDITVEYDDGMSTFSRAGGNISWTLKAKCQKRTSLFYVKKGQRINVSVAADRYVRVGIVQPDSVQRFVYGENLSHSFVAKTSGKYCVYVQNDLNFIVNVDGGYRVK